MSFMSPPPGLFAEEAEPAPAAAAAGGAPMGAPGGAGYAIVGRCHQRAKTHGHVKIHGTTTGFCPSLHER